MRKFDLLRSSTPDLPILTGNLNKMEEYDPLLKEQLKQHLGEGFIPSNALKNLFDTIMQPRLLQMGYWINFFIRHSIITVQYNISFISIAALLVTFTVLEISIPFSNLVAASVLRP